MATLEDLLANSNPDQLIALKNAANSSTQAPPMDLNNPDDLKKLIAVAKPQTGDDSDDEDESDSKSSTDKKIVEPIKDESDDEDTSDEESEQDRLKRLLSAVKQTDIENKTSPETQVAVNGKKVLDTTKPDESDEDDTEEQKSQTISPTPTSSTPAIQPEVQPTSAPAVDPRIGLLQAQMGFSNNNVAGLQAAQARAADERRTANLLQASATLGGVVAGQANHAVAPTLSSAPYDEMRKNAEVQVKNFQEQGEQEKNDPNSEYSKSFQQFAKPLLVKLKIDPTMFDNASANQINSTFPMLTKMYDAAQATEANRLKQQELTQDRAAKNDLRQQMIDLQAQKNETQAGAKGSNDQNKALQQTKQLLESARGNPAAAQAEKDLYAASKVKSLGNLYGDPDKLSPQMVQMLTSEVAKIAAGGTSTQGELEALNPGTLQGKLAGVWQKLSNQPSPANAAAFVNQYQDYANALGKDAQKVIEDKYGRIINSSKKQLGDDNYKSLEDEYINRFKGPTPAGTGSAYPKTVINKATGQQATVSNDNEYKEAQAQGFN